MTTFLETFEKEKHQDGVGEQGVPVKVQNVLPDRYREQRVLRSTEMSILLPKGFARYLVGY